jgi:hypothetical protein
MAANTARIPTITRLARINRMAVPMPRLRVLRDRRLLTRTRTLSRRRCDFVCWVGVAKLASDFDEPCGR